MNIIETTAPINIEELKKYFIDNTTFYLIDYKNSSLKGTKLLTYLSNLDIPCDVKFDDIQDAYELLECYLVSPTIVKIQSLELLTIDVLMCYKGLIDYHEHDSFIEEHKDILAKWTAKLDSLTLYNMYTIEVKEFKDFAMSHPHDDTDDLAGINFISLLKHEHFYSFYEKIEQTSLKFYTKYFNDYMFKGNNLYSYWATPTNPLFITTWGIATGEFNVKEYEATLAELKELEK